jgi:hypothetical protein
MDINQLRIEYIRLLMPADIDTSLEVIDIYCEFFSKAIIEHQPEMPANVQEGEARLLLQMMLTKCLHLKTILPGTGFKTKRGDVLNKIVDPTIIASLVRNVFETIALFHLIYVKHVGKSRDIVYNLWVVSGLKYRQRFESHIRSENYYNKLHSERETISRLTAEIESNEDYLALSEDGKELIKKQLKKYGFLITITNGHVQLVSWREMATIIGLRKELFENLYTYFSLYSHPSNVSVFQFGSMFEKGKASNVSLAKLNIQYLYALCSVFISDYISLFPEVLQTFGSLNIVEQAIIDSNYGVARGREYHINDCLKAFG